GIAARAPGDVAAHADAVARLPVHAHTRTAQGHVVGRLGPEEDRAVALDMALVIEDGGLQRLIELVAPFRGHQPAAVAAGLAGRVGTHRAHATDAELLGGIEVLVGLLTRSAQPQRLPPAQALQPRQVPCPLVETPAALGTRAVDARIHVIAV